MPPGPKERRKEMRSGIVRRAVRISGMSFWRWRWRWRVRGRGGGEEEVEEEDEEEEKGEEGDWSVLMLSSMVGLGMTSIKTMTSSPMKR